MLRLQAFVVGQTGSSFDIKVMNVDSGATYTYNITADNDGAAAMEAIRRVEELDEKLTEALRVH